MEDEEVKRDKSINIEQAEIYFKHIFGLSYTTSMCVFIFF